MKKYLRKKVYPWQLLSWPVWLFFLHSWCPQLAVRHTRGPVRHYRLFYRPADRYSGRNHGPYILFIRNLSGKLQAKYLKLSIILGLGTVTAPWQLYLCSTSTFFFGHGPFRFWNRSSPSCCKYLDHRVPQLRKNEAW